MTRSAATRLALLAALAWPPAALAWEPHGVIDSVVPPEVITLR